MKKNTKNYGKKIAALSIAGFMTASVSGCCEDTIKYKINEGTNQEKLVGVANLESIKFYYIIEMQNIDESTTLYLVKNNGSYKIIGTDIQIINSYNKSSTFGTFVQAIPLSYYIPCYSEVKNYYSAEELLEIFEKIKEDWPNYNDKINDNVKILKMKK